MSHTPAILSIYGRGNAWKFGKSFRNEHSFSIRERKTTRHYSIIVDNYYLDILVLFFLGVNRIMMNLQQTMVSYIVHDKIV